MTHHNRQASNPLGPVPERDFLEGHALMLGVRHDDPRRRKLLQVEALIEAFPFHPAHPQRILLRLTALSAMWLHPTMEAWKATAGPAELGEIALRVAANQALRADERFEPQDFFAEMLRRMEGEGSA